MNFDKFSKRWIEDNIPVSQVYGDKIKKLVAELCQTLVNQHHSGISFTVTTDYLNRLVSEYDEQT